MTHQELAHCSHPQASGPDRPGLAFARPVTRDRHGPGPASRGAAGNSPLCHRPPGLPQIHEAPPLRPAPPPGLSESERAGVASEGRSSPGEGTSSQWERGTGAPAGRRTDVASRPRGFG